MVSVAGGATVSNVTPKIESNPLKHKGNFEIIAIVDFKCYLHLKTYDFKFIDSPVSDRFISPAPGQPNVKMVKQIAVNENKQYFSFASRNNSISLSTATGQKKKNGTLGLFFRKVSNCVIVLNCIYLKNLIF